MACVQSFNIHLHHWKLLLCWFRPYSKVGANLVPSKGIPMAKIITSSCGVNTPKKQVRPAIVIGTLKMLLRCESSSSQQGACFSRGMMPENAYLCMRGRILFRRIVCCTICCKTVFFQAVIQQSKRFRVSPKLWCRGLPSSHCSVIHKIKRSQSKEDYKNRGQPHGLDQL